jgi:3D (Asp-Asp-Asp) domain-containing protein
MIVKLPYAAFAGAWYAGCGALVALAHFAQAAPSPVSPRPSLVRRIVRVAPKHLARCQRQMAWDCDIHAVPRQRDYSRRYRVRATAYMPRPAEGGRYTVTERDGRAAHGIAVDPRLIPLGTRLWIPGYGHAVADDIGSAIKGHHIDIRVQDHDREIAWGSRQIQVYVLADPIKSD